jgi:hypothetical protein
LELLKQTSHPQTISNDTSPNFWALALGTSAIASGCPLMGRSTDFLSRGASGAGCLHRNLVSLSDGLWAACGLSSCTQAISYTSAITLSFPEIISDRYCILRAKLPVFPPRVAAHITHNC